MITKFELRRKLFHLILGTTLSAIIWYELASPLIFLIITILGLIIILFAKSHTVPLITPLLHIFERKQHLRSFPGKGIFFFFLASTLCLYLFPKNITVASLLILTFGDATAHLIGASYGRIPNLFSIDTARKIEGLIAGITVSTIVASPFVSIIPAFIGSSIALLLESIAIQTLDIPLDDNLLIPLTSGAVIYLLTVLF